MVIESLSVMFENWRSYINNLLLVFQSKGPRVLPKNTWQYSWWGLLFEPRNSESNALINGPPRLSHAVVPTNVSILTLLCSCSSAVQCSFSLIPDCIALDHRSQRPGKLLHQSCSERETISNKTPTCLLLVIIFVVALLYIIYAEDWDNFTILPDRHWKSIWRCSKDHLQCNSSPSSRSSSHIPNQLTVHRCKEHLPPPFPALAHPRLRHPCGIRGEQTCLGCSILYQAWYPVWS